MRYKIMGGELEEPFGQTMAWILRANGPDFSRCRLTNRTYDFHAHYFITCFGCCGPSLCGLWAASKRDLHMLCIENQTTLYCCYANGHYALAPRKTTCAFIDRFMTVSQYLSVSFHDILYIVQVWLCSCSRAPLD